VATVKAASASAAVAAAATAVVLRERNYHYGTAKAAVAAVEATCDRFGERLLTIHSNFARVLIKTCRPCACVRG
jgi:hypothetical protein